MKHIFLTPKRREELRSHIDRKDPTALAILNKLNKSERPLDKGNPDANERANQFDRALALACLAWLNEDKARATEALHAIEELVCEPPRSDLGKGADALAAVLTWDFLHALWEAADRRRFASKIASMAESFLEVTKGNPHIVTNNWWMITHGGCLLACIAVDGEEGENGPIDLADLKAWTFERYKAFCHVFGSAGLYHEGSGYIAYTLSALMPALVAVQRHLDPDFLDEFPQLRKSLVSMLTGTATFRHHDSGAQWDGFGASLQWNDAGRGALALNPFIPAMEVTREEWRGAAREWFDRLVGVRGRNDWACSYRGLPLAVALYPFSTTPEDPDKVLPRWTVDQRQGLGMWRDRWGDGTETVLGWYARCTHAGGHRQDDAASIRMMSLGRTWICGGGQARASAEWQSVFTHANMADRPKPAPLAHLTCSHLQDASGVVGMDTRKSLGAYSERYLSWRTDLPFPLVLTTLDLLDDHRDPPLDWQWTLSFPRDLQGSVDTDGAAFRLHDPERGTLHARFLIDKPDQLEIAEMPASSRTYSNGTKVDYPGDFFVRGRFNGIHEGRVLVCMALTGADAPAPSMTLSHPDLLLGETRWATPFAPAILKTVDLAQSCPNRMTLPAG